MDFGTLERDSFPIFGIGMPETYWFARVRFSAKDKVMNLDVINFEFYECIDVSVPILKTLSTSRKAKTEASRIAREAFPDFF